MLREKVYYAEAELGKREGDLTKEEKEVKPSPIDERYETDQFTAHRSILEKVATNMGLTIDFTNDTAIEKFVTDFNALPEAKRRQYGVWK